MDNNVENKTESTITPVNKSHESELKNCGETTPQQHFSYKNIKNSIFNTISKIVNPATKVPEIQDFEIVKPISRGAFGKVFLGYKKKYPEKVYAIKAMRKKEMLHKNMASQVVIERDALALTRSPYCVQLFYSLQSDSCVYLVMEYMVGGDLKSFLGNVGYMEESMAAFYTAEVCLALEYLHSHGIVHRDLKPDNMLLSHEGHVKLTDFGLSQIAQHRDLEISDLVNCTPSLCMRTPGQLLSLTSHLSFGSAERAASTCASMADGINDKSVVKNLLSDLRRNSTPRRRQSTNDSEDDAHVSGVDFFQSIEDFQPADNRSSTGSYRTCETSPAMKKNHSTPEDEESTLEGDEPLSEVSPLSTCPSVYMRGMKRKRAGMAHTGLTQEICMLEMEEDLTPKKKTNLNFHSSPNVSVNVKGLQGFKPRRNSMHEGCDGRVAFSTPVSGVKDGDKNDLAKLVALKATRFDLPPLRDQTELHTTEELHSPDVISPIKTPSRVSNGNFTPYRTPKNIRRGAQGSRQRTDDRILGTPDYLAPELLLKQGHGPAVDWWALGVCLYEFCTGIPPFNDDNPQAVFTNILARDVPWPEGDEALSESAMKTIDALLTLDPGARPSAKELRTMEFFKGFPWDEPEKATPPFIPQPDDNYDTYYFQARNVMQHLTVSSCEN